MYLFIDLIILTLRARDNVMPESIPAWFNDACWDRMIQLEDEFEYNALTKHEQRVFAALYQLHQV